MAGSKFSGFTLCRILSDRTLFKTIMYHLISIIRSIDRLLMPLQSFKWKDSKRSGYSLFVNRANEKEQDGYLWRRSERPSNGRMSDTWMHALHKTQLHAMMRPNVIDVEVAMIMAKEFEVALSNFFKVMYSFTKVPSATSSLWLLKGRVRSCMPSVLNDDRGRGRCCCCAFQWEEPL